MIARASARIEPVRTSVVAAVVLAAGWIGIARPYGPIGAAVWLAILVMIGLVVVAIPGVGDSTPVPVGPSGVPLPERWAAACAAHDDVLSAYGAYELDSEFLLKYPGLTDLTAPPATISRMVGFCTR